MLRAQYQMLILLVARLYDFNNVEVDLSPLTMFSVAYGDRKHFLEVTWECMAFCYATYDECCEFKRKNTSHCPDLPEWVESEHSMKKTPENAPNPLAFIMGCCC